MRASDERPYRQLRRTSIPERGSTLSKGICMGLLRMAARTAVVAGTATAVSGRVANRQANKYDQQAQEQYDQQAAEQVTAPAATPEDAQTAQLQSLAQLHSQGILSDEEFAAAKAKALGI